MTAARGLSTRRGARHALVACLCAWATLAGTAWAHRFSESTLALDVVAQGLSGTWDIALHDLAQQTPLGDLPTDLASAHGWLAARPALAGVALGRLLLTGDGKPCPAQALRAEMATRDGELHLQVAFAAPCEAAPRQLGVDAQALFSADPRHQMLLKLNLAEQIRVAAFTEKSARQGFSLRDPPWWEHVASDLRSGVWHIWTGLDHVLFLLCLLLPAVLLRGSHHNTWGGAKAVVVEVLKVVTAFTIAHSLTLSLAALHLVSLPSRLTESAIALSVLFAALLNIRPVAHLRRWQAAFGFGLVHGFGFASALEDLGGNGASLVATLAAFNVGVEAGQLVVVSVFLPLAYAFALRAWYRPVVLRAGSIAIALLATVWFAERAFNLKLLPEF